MVESDGAQTAGVAQVGQALGETPAVKVEGTVVLGVETLLSEEPVPLGRGGLNRVGEVQRSDDLAALPATVARSG